jgi:hypothetical protein
LPAPVTTAIFPAIGFSVLMSCLPLFVSQSA